MDLDLDRFMQQLIGRKDYVDSCLKECLKTIDGYPPLIHEAMRYAVLNGGKRLRPILVFEGALLAGGSKATVASLACAIEMVHCYSLVHDDLPAMDDDDFRRGQPTCHKVFGEANAILAGDALLTAAFELMAGMVDRPEIESNRLLRVIREVAAAVGSRGMIGGQVIDLESENKEIDYETLQKLHSLKTGELFRASLRSGAILSGMSEVGLASLDNYARHFGLAFQITDDILDVEGNEEVIGKPVGSDQKNLKTTYPRLFGLQRSYELASESVQACLTSLSAFGPEADFLRELALFTLQRQS